MKFYLIGRAPEKFLDDLTFLGLTQAHVARGNGSYSTSGE